jgi:dihydroflavonol-4-reductase
VRVLVTGGTGFVGSQIVAALVRRGDAVRVLHRAASKLIMLEGLPVEHFLGDVLEPDAVACAVAGCDLVFHVAAVASYWRTQREQVYRVNVEGTRIVMEACLAAGVPRVVHTSSVAAISIPRNGRPADESATFDAFSATFAYADSKHRAEAVVLQAVARGLPAVIVNPGAVYGAGDHNLISGSMVLELARRSVPLVPDGGLCVVDIDAVVQGHLTAAERGRIGERYILGGENLTLLKIATEICAVVGRRAPRAAVPAWTLPPAALAMDAFNRLGLGPPVVSGEQIRMAGLRVFYDTTKAVRELDYPLLPFRGAVEKTYRWYQENGYLN